jgi:hypothetical protein
MTRHLGTPRFDAMVRTSSCWERLDTLEKQRCYLMDKATLVLCQLHDDDLVDAVEWLQQRFPGRV